MKGLFTYVYGNERMLRYLDTIKGRKSLSNPDPNVHQDLDGNYG